jgi:succinyl-CoA synthetase beta subunit
LRLFEYEAKHIFQKFGIPIPKGELVSTPTQAQAIAKVMGTPLLLKAQILSGSRGKIGGIQTAYSLDEIKEKSSKLIGHYLGSLKVNKLLVEERLNVERELYLAVTIDATKRMPILIVSSEGGVEIEEIGKETPEKIVIAPIDIFRGLLGFEAREIVKSVGLTGSEMMKTSNILCRLYKVFRAYNAEIAEINPLIITTEGNIIAADAVLNIEDHSLVKHPVFQALKLTRIENSLEREGVKMGLNYVDLHGSLALVGNGAGLVMMLIDVVKQEGGDVACFLDTGGGLSTERMKNAMNLLFKKCEQDSHVKAIFFMFRLMISPPDAMAQGILSVLSRKDPKLPLIGVISGRTKYVKRAHTLLQGSAIELYPTMEQGIKAAITLSR